MAKRKQASPTTEAAAETTSRAVSSAEAYTVLARRYRPQQFADLVGQEPVAQALVNALQSNRVAHAYLFTGARGVGKTSTARILAKALNCVQGPTPTPCDQCDICHGIASGDDVDVVEIDGASNRTIEDVRSIRQNVQFHPSRARHKIYIIDEVHMLTKEAFNALLKTLEEPPPHVKFIFATTDVHRVPVTILSRCQRFDFASIGTVRIVDRLRQVVAAEGLETDEDALELVARRAGGSMRDAQSLLDQLLAFGGKRLTADHVHRLLGTAPDDRVIDLAGAVLENDAKRALELLDQADREGLQLGELLDQLIHYWRDLMVLHCAGTEARDLSVSSRHREAITRQASSRSLDTILAGLEVLSGTKNRLRGSTHARTWMEMALVRLARLDDLLPLAELVKRLGEGEPEKPGEAAKPASPAPGPSRMRPAESASVRPAATVASQGRPLPSVPSPTAPAPTPLTVETLPQVWSTVLEKAGKMLANVLESASFPAISVPNSLVIRLPIDYNPEYKSFLDHGGLERAQTTLRTVTGQAWTLRVQQDIGPGPTPPLATSETRETTAIRQRQQLEEKALDEPLVKRAREVLNSSIIKVDEGFGAPARGTTDRAEDGETEDT